MKYNKTILLTSILGLMTYSSVAQSKITYGVGLDVFQTKLNNVDRENFSGYGHSVPEFTQNDKLGFGLNGIARISLYKNFGVETGLGVARYQSQFHFNYFHSFFNRNINEILNIELNYLKIPLIVNYNKGISRKSKISLAAGIDLKLLLWANDNFDNIVLEEIGLPNVYNRYQSNNFAYSACIAYQYKLNTKNTFEIGLHAERGINAMVKNNPNYPENFGFYANLHKATYSQYGISIKYFFTH